MSTYKQPPEPLQMDTYTARVLKQYIWKRCNVNNEHFMGCIVGREGSGKSGTAISIASVCDPTFDATRVHFRPQEFLETLQEGSDREGQLMVMDEAGVGMGVRSWYEKSQILFNKALQVCRDENMGVIWTLPALEDLDSQSERRLHALIEMAELKENHYSRFRWKNLEPTRDGKGELWNWYPRRKEGRRRNRVTKLQIGKPPADVWEPYQERKQQFQQELYEQARESYEDDGPDKRRSPSEIADEIIDSESIDSFMSTHGGNGSKFIDWKLVRAEYDLSRHDAKTVKSLIEKQAEV